MNEGQCESHRKVWMHRVRAYLRWDCYGSASRREALFFPSLHCCFWKQQELGSIHGALLGVISQPRRSASSHNPTLSISPARAHLVLHLSICIFVWQFLWDQFSDILAVANAPDNSDHRVRGTLKPFISNKMATPSWEANQKRNRKRTRPRRNKGLDISWKRGGKRRGQMVKRREEEQ